MKRMNQAVLVAIAIAGSAAALMPSAANADERICRGTIGAATVDGDILVNSGTNCSLVGTVVNGNVFVARGATLRTDRARINNNVQAEGHTRVVLLPGTTVGGSVQLKQGGAARIDGVRVTGDIQLFTNTGAQLITRNRVNGNMQCKENRPAPTGSGNVVQGNKEDQCRRL